jgi:hypothetical protein
VVQQFHELCRIGDLDDEAWDLLSLAAPLIETCPDPDIRLARIWLLTHPVISRRNLVASEAEALSGIRLADSCLFGLFSIDLRLRLSWLAIAACKPGEAIEPASEAILRAGRSDCQYAWGEADGLHLLGVASARLGESETARRHLVEANMKRRSLGHPRLNETEQELAALGG